MVFSSLIFLFIFLPVVILFYYFTPNKYRNLILFIFSLIFYAWGEPIYIVLMLFSTLVDYTHGFFVDKYRERKNFSRVILLSSVLINLGLLGFFKYYDFLLNSINVLVGTSFKGLELPLPIGISFYTFQTMSYTIDVYRNEAPVQRNLITFGAYVSLFPQLIAGPIVRYNTVAKQLFIRTVNFDSFGEGIRRFVIGLGKKVLLANNIGLLWRQIQEVPSGELTVLGAWLGIIAFSFQIYFDFSGYSDMAIGLGKIFGFTFLENFNYPYISQSITEFWRRWHISLGTWFREYVYIPLGGNRFGKLKQYRNLLIVWFLTGLWHGASWNFVLWGLYFGLIIVLEKTFLLKWLKKAPLLIRYTYTGFLVMLSWILFLFENLSDSFYYFKALFGLNYLGLYDNEAIYLLYTHVLLIIISAVGSTPLVSNFTAKLKESYFRLYCLSHGISYLLILIFSTAYLVDATYNPFLYFRF